MVFKEAQGILFALQGALATLFACNVLIWIPVVQDFPSNQNNRDMKMEPEEEHALHYVLPRQQTEVVSYFSNVSEIDLV